MRYLVTGGEGYAGGIIASALSHAGHECVIADIAAEVPVDVSDETAVEALFARGKFDGVVHCAARLQLGPLYTRLPSPARLRRASLSRWERVRVRALTRPNASSGARAGFEAVNIGATRILAEACVRHGVRQLVYISSNCVYGRVNALGIPENAPRQPFEAYGKSKAASEDILFGFAGKLNSVILRPPTIVGAGRLGILSVVYDFVREGRVIWMIGGGENRYQFVYGPDLAEAARLALLYPKTAAFNVGSDDPPSLNGLFQALIDAAESKSRIRKLPGGIFIPALKAAHAMGISPLGPYQYNMIASSYSGDTSAIKRELGWRPTRTNAEMLIEGYRHYLANYDAIHSGHGLKGHRRAGKGGILTLVKWVS